MNVMIKRAITFSFSATLIVIGCIAGVRAAGQEWVSFENSAANATIRVDLASIEPLKGDLMGYGPADEELAGPFYCATVDTQWRGVSADSDRDQEIAPHCMYCTREQALTGAPYGTLESRRNGKVVDRTDNSEGAVGIIFLDYEGYGNRSMAGVAETVCKRVRAQGLPLSGRE